MLTHAPAEGDLPDPVDRHAGAESASAATADAAAAQLSALTGAESHDLAVVLGSGWGPAADLIGRTLARVGQSELPGFAPSAVPGHSSTLRSVAIADTGRRALVFGTRTHLYEGRGVDAVVHAVRTAAAAGCRAVVLTNGCGSINPSWLPGTIVLIRDHINLTGVSPLTGARFVDLTDLYGAQLRETARQVDPGLPEGVYVQFRGPQFETPAEVRMAAVMGGDLVGMSTAVEAVAARAAGLSVLGLSLVTNLAAGVSARPLDHREVLAAGEASAARCGRLLADVVTRL
jgi:purine-nucleoside phosphorylase